MWRRRKGGQREVQRAISSTYIHVGVCVVYVYISPRSDVCLCASVCLMCFWCGAWLLFLLGHVLATVRCIQGPVAHHRGEVEEEEGRGIGRTPTRVNQLGPATLDFPTIALPTGERDTAPPARGTTGRVAGAIDSTHTHTRQRRVKRAIDESHLQLRSSLC